MDTTFIIGSSGSVGSRNWIRLLSFVQTLNTLFGVSPSGSHVALIPYSTDAKLALKFNTLPDSLLNVAEVNRQIARLRWQRGFNRIDKAMALAAKEGLTTAAGIRDVSKVNWMHIVVKVIVLMIMFFEHTPVSFDFTFSLSRKP